MKTLAKKDTLSLLIPLVLALLASTAQAQYTINWFTIDGGGGVSTGGVYSVSGTIGQPDAGAMSGGNFTVQGGFWSMLAAVQTPGAPLLSITLTNSIVRVSWPLPATGFLLEQTNRLTGLPALWPQVSVNQYQTNATDIYFTTPSSPGTNFYRLRKP